jgi:hypothetical protein
MARDQYAALLEVLGDLGRIETIAVPPPNFGPHQDMIGLGVPIEQFGRLLLDHIGLGRWGPSFGGLVNADEMIQPGNKIGFDPAADAHDLTGSVDVAPLRHPAAHARDDAGISFCNAPRQQTCLDRHAQSGGIKSKAIHHGAHLRMCLLDHGDDFGQRQKMLTMLIEDCFNSSRADLDKMLLPRETDRAVLTLHYIKETFAFNVDLIACNRLERAVRLNLSRYVNQTFARTLLQARANKLRQRFFTGAEYQH